MGHTAGHKYFRFIDTKRWDEWRTLFTGDVTFKGLSHPYRGADESCSSTSKWLNPANDIHQGHMPEIDVTGEDSATGI